MEVRAIGRRWIPLKTILQPSGRPPNEASALLANIALDPLHWRLDECGFRFAHYPHDFVLLFASKRHARKARRRLAYSTSLMRHPLFRLGCMQEPTLIHDLEAVLSR